MQSTNTNTVVSGTKILIKFLPFLWKNKSLGIRLGVVVALLLIPVTIAINLCIPIIFKDIINSLNDKFNTTESVVLLLICSYGLLWTLSAMADKVREMVFFWPICRAITDYSLTVFKHIQDLSLKFHLGRQTGKITTAIDSSQLAIAMVITNILFRMLPILLEIILAFVIIGYLYGMFYASILIATVITYLIWGAITQPIELKISRRFTEIEGQGTARIVDNLLNIETVKYFNNHEPELKIAQRFHMLLTTLAIRNTVIYNTIRIVYAAIVATGLGLMSYYAAIDVIQHKFKLGDFILINSYVILFLVPLYDLTGLMINTKFNLARIEPSAELLNEKREIEHYIVLPKLEISQAELSFENVNFSYLPEISILKNLSFKVPSGSTVAIVGPSGCGKSTIARLILRLFDADSGHIKIDNQDIQQCDPNSIRAVIGCVPQDIALFNNTLRYNICYGTFTCSDQEVTEMTRITQLQSFIQQLPLGLDTQVGERGLKLSGGERQRIALARALLKRPSIIVLDEATSSLDMNTEQAIHDNIAQAAKEITTVIIAHRLSTIVDADQIIVLDNGQVAEQGTHNQLLEKEGLYAQLWRQQRHV